MPDNLHSVHTTVAGKHQKTVFTRRGLVLFGAAGVTATLAYILDQIDLARLPFFLALLPALAWLYLRCTTNNWTVTRGLSPTTCSPGQHVAVKLRLHRAKTGLALEVTDQAPTEIGGSRHFALSGWASTQGNLDYQIAADRRGVWQVGELTATAYDPLGLAQSHWAAPSHAEFAVQPKVHPLAGEPPKAGSRGGGEGGSTGASLSGEPDVTVREYRRGDSLRRIHWRATAKRTDLMVRNAMHRSPNNAVIVLDNRQASYTTGSDSSFEWAVSAVASYVNQLHLHHWHVRVFVGTRSFEITAGAPGSLAQALNELAVITTTTEDNFAMSVYHARQSPAVAQMAVFTGALTNADVQPLLDCTQTTPAGLAIILDHGTQAIGGFNAPSVDQSQARSAAQAAIVHRLQQTGWAAATPAPTESISVVLNDLLSAQQVAR